MQHTNVIIIGGGLAGLHTANGLKALNIPCILLEAKDHLGGRIDSVSASNIEQEPREFASQFDHSHDMGPTWIFPHQYKIQALVKELGLKLFEQYAAGDVLFQAQKRCTAEANCWCGCDAIISPIRRHVSVGQFDQQRIR
ncbi:FAD-dependent oxidoreductase [Paraglaciecola sp. Hal342]